MVAIPHLPPHTGGNPRTRPGSSVVGVAYLLGGAAWYAALGASGCGGVFPEGAAVAGLPRFVELPLLAFVSCSFLSLGLLCCSPQRRDVYYVGWLLWNTKRGGTLFRYEDET